MEGRLSKGRLPWQIHMPRMGTENIRRLLFATDRSQVSLDLGAVLPERT
jgi:hypothetical protein